MSKKEFANEVDRQYHELLEDIMENGDLHVNDRTGTGTKAVFGRQLRFNLKEGLPAITTKKMFFKGIIVELLWFLGNHQKEYSHLPIDNQRYLLDNGVKIWVGDAYKAYLKYVNNPEIEDECIYWCIDDPNENCLRPATEDEFIDLLKTDHKFSLKFGGIGPGYGWQWRNFGGNYKGYKNSFYKLDRFTNRGSASFPDDGIDQIKNVIESLKGNPKDRRLLVSAWNPMDNPNVLVPPCHHGFNLYTRELSRDERINVLYERGVDVVNDENIDELLHTYDIPKHGLSILELQRSIDTPLGLGFNLTSYAILLELLAREVNMVADELVMSLGNTHIYLNQQDGVKEQLSRDSIYKLPKLVIDSNKSIFDLSYKDIKIVDYQSHGSIKFPLSN